MPDSVKVFLVEDDKAAAETCRTTIEKKLPGIKVKVEGDFAKALVLFEEEGADILILDLYDDPLGQAEGNPIWVQVWTKKFCPIIFHTAHELPEEPEVPTTHPFIRIVKKASGSDDEVAAYIKSFLPHASAIRKVLDEIATVIQIVLKDVSTHIWETERTSEECSEILTRTARRRVAAMMDLQTLSTGKLMENWEEYIVPPLSNDLLLGDLLRQAHGTAGNPASFRLVLTPSCDMVAGRSNRVKTVLVAKCTDIHRFLSGAMIDPQTPDGKKRDKLPSALRQDQWGGFIPLPEYPGVLPLMAADLRDLELLPIDDIGLPQSPSIKYGRIASIDSPFRERIGWAYVQMTGRPGVPECDMDAFVETIILATKPVR